MSSEHSVEELFSRLPDEKVKKRAVSEAVQPVHVVYGGAHLFKEETPEKLGRIALESQRSYAPDFITFAKAMWLNGADSLPDHMESVIDLIEMIDQEPELAEERYPGSGFCLEVFRRTIEKLRANPVEDFRIDFEDGYGFRTEAEEDGHAESASTALAEILLERREDSPPPIRFGFRIKSFQPETRLRAHRTLERFLANLIEKMEGRVPSDLVVTLPKVNSPDEVEILAELLDQYEATLAGKRLGIGIEIMIETPDAVSRLAELADRAPERLRAAHFGAYDYTAALGIASGHQHLRHEACNFARNAMLNAFAPRGIWLADSVTTEMPVPVHRGGVLDDIQMRENAASIHKAWRSHFNNVTYSMINGFYQSWDLHPAQLVARYAAVFAFYLAERARQAARLRSFVDKASKAVLTGNVFDDAASAEGLLNFFRRGCACGAFDHEETALEIGLDPKHLGAGNFAEIMAEKMNS
jgi:citrate lyase beta subunit